VECPAEAIYQESDVPESQKDFIELNAELAKVWPVITEVIAAPIDAEQWDGIPNKIENLITEFE
jgi:ferredoxin